MAGYERPSAVDLLMNSAFHGVACDARTRMRLSFCVVLLSIRRLRAIRDTEGLRVLVQLEPALDSSAIHPAWMANRDVRIDELR